MDIRLIAFSAAGSERALKIASDLRQSDSDVKCICFASPRYADNIDIRPVSGLDQWTRESFFKSDALIFVCASGIAVRAIAPYVNKKTEDPAVIVADERGRYVIPILSGHLGGANALAHRISSLSGGEAVVTTATDLDSKFAVDTFADKNGLFITDMKLAKEISSAVLRNEKVGFSSEVRIKGEIPQCLEPEDEGSEEEGTSDHIFSIHIGKKNSRKNTLLLRPRPYVLGMGCRRGKSFEDIEKAALYAVSQSGISMEDVGIFASADIKKDEEGFRMLCRKYRLKPVFFSSEKLAEAEGDFTASDFVKKTVGVDNVCERAAASASQGGSLVFRKYSKDGVTAAVALIDKDNLEVRFE